MFDKRRVGKLTFSELENFFSILTQVVYVLPLITHGK